MTSRLTTAFLAALFLAPTLGLAAQPRLVTGLVHSPDGRPVAGAEVFLLESAGEIRLGGCISHLLTPQFSRSSDIGGQMIFCACLRAAKEVVRAQRAIPAGKTDSAGRFEFDLNVISPRQPFGSKTLFAEANGLVGAVRRLGKGPLVIELAAPPKHSGTVVTPDGLPVAGATVLPVPALPNHPAATSAADGSFQVETLGQAFDGLLISGPGLLPIFLKPGRQYVALRPVTLQGAVTSAGKPVPGAAVTVRPICGEPLELKADASGHFEVPGIAPLQTAIDAQSGGQVAQFLDAPRTGEPVKLELAAGKSIVGTVFDADGKPVAGVTVHAKDNLQREHKATTDASGNYVITPVGDGGYSVGLEKQVGNKGHVLLKPAARSARHDIRLVTFEATYEGTVVDTNGAPVAGASVSVDQQSLLEPPPKGCRTSTDASGRFVCRDLVRDRNLVKIEGKGLKGAFAIVDVPAQGPQRFVVMRAVVVRGRLLDSKGKPIQGGVSLDPAPLADDRNERVSTQHTVYASVDEQGRFEFSEVGPGSYMLSAEWPAGPDRRPDSASKPLLVEEGVSPPEVILTPGRGPVIRGKVADGPRESRVEVLAFAGRDTEGAPAAQALLDHTNSFMLAVPSEGEYTLIARTRGYVSEKPVRARSGQTGVGLKLKIGAVVQGTVVLPDGKPARGFTVNGERFGSADGSFELASVPAAPLRLKIEAQGFPPMERLVVPAHGSTLKMTIRLSHERQTRRSGPEEQLAELERYGQVPFCVQRREPLSPPTPGLKVTVAELQRYLESSYEPVLRRAVNILCAVRDEPARKAIDDLYERHPCLEWLEEAANLVGPPRFPRDRFPACPSRRHGGKPDYYGFLAEEILTWVDGTTLERSRRISAGDEEAFREAMLDQANVSPVARRKAIAALARIDAVAALRELMREELNLVYEKWRAGRHNDNRALDFVAGVGGAALASVVERTGSTRPQVLLQVSEEMTAEEGRALARFLFSVEELRSELRGFADSPEARRASAPGAVAFLGRIRDERRD